MARASCSIRHQRVSCIENNRRKKKASVRFSSQLSEMTLTNKNGKHLDSLPNPPPSDTTEMGYLKLCERIRKPSVTVPESYMGTIGDDSSQKPLRYSICELPQAGPNKPKHMGHHLIERCGQCQLSYLG